ncbi:MAG: IS3 family transposase [Sphaerochaetaceae bacterium]|jgi:putative transposase|nr:IS3 family transposase [Sphaerochaetaceae bacterium]
MVEMIQKVQVGDNRTKPDCRGKDNRDSLEDFVLKDLQATYAAFIAYAPEASYAQRLMLCIVAVWIKNPFFGYRRITEYVKDVLPGASLKQIRTMMRNAGLKAMTPKPNLSAPRKGNHTFPYLLKGMEINRPNQVWSTDITYLKLPQGMMYLVAIMDVYSRKILTWRLSNTMDTSFCKACLIEAVERYGAPEILNSDQGSQFTSDEFVTLVKDTFNIKFSMNGVGRAKDNIWTERSWKSLKFEMFFLHDFQSVEELKEAVDDYWVFYNGGRRHQSLEYITPNMKYFSTKENIKTERETA